MDAGILAQPFMIGAAAASGMLSEDFKQLTDICLLSKDSQLTSLLASVIAATAVTASENAVGMLAAITDQAVQAEQAIANNSNSRTKQQRLQRGDGNHGKECAADFVQQQDLALLTLLTFARKSSAQCHMVLDLFFCRVRVWQRCVLCVLLSSKG